MNSSNNSQNPEPTSPQTKEGEKQVEGATNEQPKKPQENKAGKKKISIKKVLLVCFVILILTVVGVLAYLYINKGNIYQSLLGEKGSLEEEKESLESEIETLESEKATLEEEKATLEEENTTLEAEVTDYEAKQTKIKAYNDFNAYVYYVIGIHGGFINLTDAEYQEARSKAEATGDTDLVAAVDSAWNDTSVSQVIRFVNVMNAAIEGIDENCQEGFSQ